MNVATWPTATLPMSASLTFVSTCILVRSCAIVNNVGACRLAATVWPISTLREMTVPLMGERMMVRSRSTWACSSAAWAW